MQVLPPNPVLGGKTPAPKGLPPNPVAAALSGKTAPAAKTAAPPANPLTGLATHIATGGHFSPVFVKSLQAMQQKDPTFQTRLNAEISRVSSDIRAKRDSGIAGTIGKTVEQSVNPLEWVKGAIQGAPHVVHGAGKVARGNIGGGAAEAGLGALGVAGILPFGRGAGLLGDALRTGRTAEEASAHLSEVAAAAKTEGHAHVPLTVPKGTATDLTGGELGRQIRESLVHAPAIRAVQKTGYSAERSLRVAAGSAAHQQAGGGLAGHLAAMRHQEGSLGAEFFGHLKHFTPEQVDEAARVIDKSPMQFWQQRRAVAAIRNAVDNGVVPTKGDQVLLEHAFGKVARLAAEQDPVSRSDKIIGWMGVPRALRSTGDVSASFRQNLTVLVTHPTVWQRNFRRSLKTLASEGAHRDVVTHIHEDPFYPLALKAKVPFTELPEPGLDSHLDTSEEYYPGTQAERLPLGVGKVVRASDRSFTDQVNLNRLELFKMNLEKASQAGYDLNDQHLLESFGKVVGMFTGRGVVPGLENHPREIAAVLKGLNVMLFAPRFMASRINLFSPVYMRSLHPAARAEVWRARRNLLGVVGSVLLTAKALGADVTMDPRSSNFGKIKVGDVRIDIGGGYEQYIRLAAQQLTLQEIASNGNHKKIGHGSASDRPTSEFDFLTHFLRGKLGPLPAYAVDWGTGKDFLGRPTKLSTPGGWAHQAFENAPFLIQDTKDSIGLGGSNGTIAKRTAISAFLSAIGLGVQSYKDKPSKASTGGNGGTGYGDSGSGYGSNTGSYGDSTGGYGSP